MKNHSLFALSLSDQNKRNENQDAIFPDLSESMTLVEQPFLCAVADGLGGEKQGKQASNLAMQQIELEQAQNPLWFENKKEFYVRLFQNSNQKIIEMAEGIAKSGTTLSSVCFHQNEITVAHVGDSKIRLYRKQKLSTLSQTHNYQNLWKEEGKQFFSLDDLELSTSIRHRLEQKNLWKSFWVLQKKVPLEVDWKEHVSHHFERLLEEKQIEPVSFRGEKMTQALGKEENFSALFLENNIGNSFPIQVNDLYLLHTDGMNLSDSELETKCQTLLDVFEKEKIQEKRAERVQYWLEDLVSESKQKGSEDNISCILVFVLPEMETLDSETIHLDKVETEIFVPKHRPLQHDSWQFKRIVFFFLFFVLGFSLGFLSTHFFQKPKTNQPKKETIDSSKRTLSWTFEPMSALQKDTRLSNTLAKKKMLCAFIHEITDVWGIPLSSSLQKTFEMYWFSWKNFKHKYKNKPFEINMLHELEPKEALLFQVILQTVFKKPRWSQIHQNPISSLPNKLVVPFLQQRRLQWIQNWIALNPHQTKNILPFLWLAKADFCVLQGTCDALQKKWKKYLPSISSNLWLPPSWKELLRSFWVTTP